jgi:hypothetical protein
MVGSTTLGAIEISLEDTMVEHIAYWIKDDYLKVQHTKADPSYSDPEASGWTYGPAAVHAGMLPKNEVGVILVDQIPVFPFVLCHITKGKDMMPEGIVHTKIVVGAWDKSTDYQGYRDCVALLRKIVRCIWYVNTLSDVFQINMEEGTEWRVYDSNEVTWPFFLCEAVLGWRLRTPYMKAESEGLDYEPQSNIVPGIPAANIPTWQPPIPLWGVVPPPSSP